MRNAAIRVVTLDATAVEVAAPSKHRRMLVFSPNLTAGYTVAPAQGVTANAGIVVTAGGGPFVLRHEDVGPLVQQAWYGVAAASTVIGVVEAYELQ